MHRLGSPNAVSGGAFRRPRLAVLTALSVVLGLLSPSALGSPARALAIASVSPTDDAHLSSIPVLQWPEAATDGDVRITPKYQVQISTVSNFASTVFNKAVVTNTATPETDLAPGLYYWRYAAFDLTNAQGDWSATHTFTRDADPGPALVAPDEAHAFTYPGEPPAMSWSPLPGMDSYLVQTAKDAAFTADVTQTTTTNTAFTPTALLDNLTGDGSPQPYYWRVRGNSVSGSTTTDWSATRSFTIVFSGTPALRQPMDLATVDEPTFEWAPVPGASQYDLWVALDNDFATTVERVTLAGTRYVPRQTYQAKAHYWKVRALDPGGSWGPWSTVRTFTRRWLDHAHDDEVARPDNVTLIGFGHAAPSNKAALTWEPVGGASHYEVDFSTDSAFPPEPPGLTITCVTPHTTLTPFLGTTPQVIGSPNMSKCAPSNFSGTRFIRVRAMAAGSGPTIWSLNSNEARTGEPVPDVATYTFEFAAPDSSDATGTGTVAAGPAQLLTPAEGSDNADAPVLHWLPVLGANSYQVYLYKDVDGTTPVFTSPEFYASTDTYFIPPASIPDNTAGQSYYWFVLPCSSADATTGCAGRNTAINQLGKYATFRKAGLPVSGASDSTASRPGVQEFGLSWDEQLVTSPDGGGVKYYEGQLSTTSLDNSTVNFTTDSRSYVLAERTLAPGATYKWRVRAVDGSGLRLAWSSEQTFTAPTASGPTVTTQAADSATPVLSWRPAAAQQAYEVEVYRGADPTFPAGSKVGTTIATPYTRYAYPSWLTPGTYSWRVRTKDAHGTPSAWTDHVGEGGAGALLTFTVTMPAPVITSPAAGVTVAEPDLVYSWAPVEGAVKYRVEIGSGSPWAVVTPAVDVVGTSYSPPVRLVAGTYSWRVSAMTGATGSVLMASAPLTPFTLLTTPTVPRSPSASVVAGTSITMSWTEPSSAGGSEIVGYQLRWRIGAGAWQAQSLGPDSRSYTLNNVEPGVSYSLQVAAENTVGRGVFTTSSTLTTPTVPGVPTNLVGTPSGTGLSVTWTTPASGGSTITGYKIDYRVDGSPEWTEVTSASRSAALSGLLPITTYNLRVAAVNAVGTGPWAEASATTGAAVPDPPGPPTAEAGNTSAAVTWSAPAFDGGADITGYTVTSTPGARTCTWSTGPLTCTVTGLANGTPYTFRVTARNSTGASSPSVASDPVTPHPTEPSAPGKPSATAGNSRAKVNWSAPTSTGGASITSYTVTSTPDGRTCTWTSGELTCTVTGLANGTPYQFTVTATNARGTSPASEASDPVTPQLTSPDAPGAPTATAGNTQATVIWAASGDDGGSAITNYTVTSTPDDRTCTWSTGSLTCTVTGLTNGTSYTFRVSATNAMGTSPASAPSSAIVPATVPDAPRQPTATAGNATATVIWSAPASNGGKPITNYTVTSTPGGRTCTTTGALTCTVTGLTNATTYQFSVTARNAVGTSTSSALSDAVTPQADPPGTPGKPSATAGNAQATVTWTAPATNGAPITLYTVTSSPGNRTCTWTTGALTCTFTGMSNGTAYQFTVTATNSAGTSAASPASDPVTPQPTVPSAPSAPTAVARNTAVDVLWSPPSSDGGSAITGYTVTSNPGGLTCATTDALTCTVTGLTNGSPYQFSVRATNRVGSSVASALSPTMTPATIPNAPGQPTASAADGRATVVWPASSSSGGSRITGYTVTSAPDGRTCATTGALTCTVTGLTNGTAYQFTVTARNALGSSAASAASNPVTPLGAAARAVPPSAPGTPSAVAGNASATVTWSAPASTGGAAVSGYAVTASPGGASCATSGELTCRVGGLTNGTSYTFTVTASNTAGVSRASTPSGAIVPGLPATVAAKAVSKKGKLYVNVNPDKGKAYWTFRVRKQNPDGSWTTAPRSYKTSGKKETRTINLPKGTYRVVVDAKFGYLSGESGPVVLVK